ncbi:MAG: hypothetical protein AB7N76_15110 [Planctomycetota bacterium]
MFIPAHTNSHYKRGETVVLVLEEIPSVGDPGVAGVGLGAAAALAVGFLVDQGVKALEREAKEYVASYGGTASSEFYERVPGSAQSARPLCTTSLTRPDTTWAGGKVTVNLQPGKLTIEVTLPSSVPNAQAVANALNADPNFKAHLSARLDGQGLLQIATRPTWGHAAMLVTSTVQGAFLEEVQRLPLARAIPRLKGFTLVRYVTRSKSDVTVPDRWYPTEPGGGRSRLELFERDSLQDSERVAYYHFRVTASEAGDAFRIQLDRARVVRSKAKVFEPRLWTRFMIYGCLVPLFTDAGDQAVDLDIDVEVIATWTDAKQATHRETLASLHWKLPDYSIENVGVDKNGDSAPAGKDPAASAPAAWKRGSNDSYQSDWIPSPPVSLDPAGKPRGMGTYTLKVSVTESDDFGDLVKQGAEQLEKNKDKIVERVVERVTSSSEAK